MSAVVAEARWLFASGVLGPPNNSIQRTALRAAADAERWAARRTAAESQPQRSALAARGWTPMP
jgi:hypothetical protein